MRRFKTTGKLPDSRHLQTVPTQTTRETAGKMTQMISNVFQCVFAVSSAVLFSDPKLFKQTVQVCDPHLEMGDIARSRLGREWLLMDQTACMELSLKLKKNINWTALKRCSLQSEWTVKRRIAIMIQARQDCVHQFFQDKHCTHCTSDQEIHLRQRICARSRLKFQGSKAQVGKMALLIQHLHHDLLKSRNVSKTLSHLSLLRTEHN